MEPPDDSIEAAYDQAAERERELFNELVGCFKRFRGQNNAPGISWSPDDWSIEIDGCGDTERGALEDLLVELEALTSQSAAAAAKVRAVLEKAEPNG